ncbi:hypothetical protein Mapa_013343 [Marchantia paleacea]|nr:hypothetical protein Mapa_013343 [Marchantia paleacea]
MSDFCISSIEPQLRSVVCTELWSKSFRPKTRTSCLRRRGSNGFPFSPGLTQCCSHKEVGKSTQSLWAGRVGSAFVAAASVPTKQNRKVTEKHEFDDIQDLIISPPSVPSSTHVGRQPPTLLEREAKALGGSTVFSRKERIEAVNGLLDLLEHKGVSSGYAFEFVRHAGDLIDDLIVEAKQMFVENVEDLSTPAEEALAKGKTSEGLGSLPNEVSIADLKREKKISKLLEIGQEEESKLSGDATLSESISELAFRVSVCAERRGLARLVHYFQLIGMKALNIPKVLPYVERGIDKVMAKVEFLRSLGVKYLHLPVILVTWPQLLSYQCDTLALNVDYLVSLGLAHKDIGKMVIKFPQILGRDVQTELHKSVEILENLGVQVRDVKKLVVRYPVLLTEDAPKKLDPLVNYLSELGVRKEHIGTVLIRRPLLLDSDVEKDLLPVGNYLKSLNASPDDIDKILMSFPQLFCYDVDQDFRPTVLHLESLGVEPPLMGKLFRRHPQLLKNRQSLELKLDFLLSLGLEPKDLGKVMYNAPQLLCLSVGENMLPTVRFLESISIEGPSLLKVLRLKPMILAYNVETKLKPNVKFLRSIQIKQGEIGKLVARHPQLLTLSIDRNLKPTVHYLLKLGFTRGRGGHGEEFAFHTRIQCSNRPSTEVWLPGGCHEEVEARGGALSPVLQLQPGEPDNSTSSAAWKAL